MQSEQLLPIHQFNGEDPKSKLEASIIKGLRRPTELVAEWYVAAPPESLYDETHKGLLDSGTFREDYLRHAEKNPLIRHPYYMLGKNWEPIPVVKNPAVKDIISRIVEPLPKIAKMIQKHPDNEDYLEFADYLMEAHKRMPAGEFDELMVAFLRQSSRANVRWLAMPVEYRGDPMGDHASPQGLLAYLDRDLTDDANRDMDLFNTAAERRFGKKPFPAWVFVANRVVASGDLALSNSPQSAFNIPNDPKVAAEAGHNVIYIHPNSIARLNRRSLAAGAFAVIGKESTTEDLLSYTGFHEGFHGYRPEPTDNDGQIISLGRMKTAVREGWAASGAVLVADAPEFRPVTLERVTMGMLTYAIDDSSDFRRQIISEPYGQNQPTLQELLKSSGYAVDGYRVTRQLILRKAVNPETGELNIDKIVEISQEGEEIYRELAESGDEEKAFNLVSKTLRETRIFKGVSFNGAAEAAS